MTGAGAGTRGVPGAGVIGVPGAGAGASGLSSEEEGAGSGAVRGAFLGELTGATMKNPGPMGGKGGSAAGIGKTGGKADELRGGFSALGSGARLGV